MHCLSFYGGLSIMSFLLKVNNVPLYEYNTFSSSVYTLMHMCDVSTSRGNVLMWQSTGRCRYLFEILILSLLNTYVEVGCLAQMMVLFLIFWGAYAHLSLVAAPVYVPVNRATSTVPRSHHTDQCVLPRGFRLAFLAGVKRYLLMGLICGSLIIGDIEHLLIHLLAACLSFSERWLLKSLFIY